MLYFCLQSSGAAWGGAEIAIREVSVICFPVICLISCTSSSGVYKIFKVETYQNPGLRATLYEWARTTSLSFQSHKVRYTNLNMN